MHDLLGVHFLQPLENGVDDPSCLGRFEFVFCLHLVVELASLKQLHHNIEGVLRLEHLVEFHTTFVVQISHDFYFLYQALLPLIFTVGCLLGEGFYGIAFSCLELLGKVYRCKVTFSYLLLWFELLVETSLIESPLQEFPAGLEISIRFE